MVLQLALMPVRTGCCATSVHTCVFPACFRNKGQQQTVTLLASKHLLHYKLAASTTVASCSTRKKAMHPEACTAAVALHTVRVLCVHVAG